MAFAVSILLTANSIIAYAEVTQGSAGGSQGVSPVLLSSGSGGGAKATSSNAWEFTYFGPSTSSKTNTVNENASIDTEVKLNSVTVKSDGTVNKKGGKFVSSDPADGISFYYTQIDPSAENFLLQADVKIDYMNPKPDGQEGFALMVRDYIGSKGDSASSESNLVSVGVTQLPKGELNSATQVKDMLGVRAYTGIDNSIKPNPETFKVYRMGFDKTGTKAKTGDTYRVRLEKTSSKYIVYQLDMGDNILYSYEIPIQAKNLNALSINSYEELNDPISVQDKYAYVGFAVARGMNATFSNIQFEKSQFDPGEWVPQDFDYIDLNAGIKSPDTAAEDIYKLVFNANADGIAKIYQNNEFIEQADILAGREFTGEYNLQNGNEFRVEFTPDVNFKPEAFVKLSSYDTVILNKKVSYRTLGKGDIIYTSNDGLETNDGSSYEFATDLETALKYAKAGQTILLKPETYDLSNKNLIVQRGKDGSEDRPIKLAGDGGFATLDFKKSGKGLSIWGNYWELKSFNITNTADGYKGLQIAGNYNKAERLNLFNNGNTGLQISGSTEETIEKWPSHNYILNCTSMNNADAAMEDADGFAAKITSGVGNVFDGCIAAYNADDGWDLFAKVASGAIGDVTIKNSVAYKNGYILVQEGGSVKNFKFAEPVIDEMGNVNFEKPYTVLDAGNGNGFKMGGSNVAGAHLLEDSVSYENKAKGIDSNSGPNIRVYNSTSYNNESHNIALYTSDKTLTTDYKARGVISFRKGSNIAEQIALQKQSADEIIDASNYFWDKELNLSQNTQGIIVTEGDFVSLDTEIAPSRNEDGAVDMHGLLVLTKEGKSKLAAGAKIDKKEEKPDVTPKDDEVKKPEPEKPDTQIDNNTKEPEKDDRSNQSSKSYRSSSSSIKNTFTVRKRQKNGWKSEGGTWKYINSGEYIIDQWAYLYNPYTNRNAWFRFDINGNMQTGTVVENGISYYLSDLPDGSKGEWLQDR